MRAKRLNISFSGFPKGEIFMLTAKNESDFILAKITEKRLKFN